MLTALSDERLVDRVRAGDVAAFEVLYDRHHRGVLAFCRHMLQSADEAEDAVQHAFISAHTDLQRDSGRDIRFKPWLYTIARNRCLSILRARREHAADEIEISTDRLSDDVLQRADLQALLADIGELPEDQRAALVLSEVGDLSHADVAGVIGCEVPKVKSLVFQARSALIERRQAREMPCSEIREQLATLRGGALRRSQLRHHLAGCPGCRAYRDDVRRQREMLALALPVIPSFALKHQVLAGLGLGGGGGAAGGGLAGGLTLSAKTGLAKLGVAALVAAGGAGTAVVVSHGHLPLVGGSSAAAPAAKAASAEPAAALAAPRGAGTSRAPGATGTDASRTSPTHHHGRSASGTRHGFTPVHGQSNGAAAREFAKTRGKGEHTGLYKTHRHHAVRHRHSTVVAPVRRVPTTRTRATAPKAPSSPTGTTTETPTTTSTATTTTTRAGDHGKGGGGAAALP